MNHIRLPILLSAALALLLLPTDGRPQTRPTATGVHNFARWEKEISAYERADREHPPAKGGAVFTGASSIRMWKTLAEDFPGANVINRGFGGSQTADATHFADRIVLPYEPKMVLLRAGGNDIHAGRTAEQVLADFQAFVAKVHATLPETTVVYIAQTAAPARWNERDEDKKLNDLVEAWAKDRPGVKYVEAWDLVMRPDGTAREDLFLPDKLHFNAEGYRLLAERVRPVIPKAE